MNNEETNFSDFDGDGFTVSSGRDLVVSDRFENNEHANEKKHFIAPGFVGVAASGFFLVVAIIWTTLYSIDRYAEANTVRISLSDQWLELTGPERDDFGKHFESGLKAQRSRAVKEAGDRAAAAVHRAYQPVIDKVPTFAERVYSLETRLLRYLSEAPDWVKERSPFDVPEDSDEVLSHLRKEILHGNASFRGRQVEEMERATSEIEKSLVDSLEDLSRYTVAAMPENEISFEQVDYEGSAEERGAGFSIDRFFSREEEMIALAGAGGVGLVAGGVTSYAVSSVTGGTAGTAASRGARVARVGLAGARAVPYAAPFAILADIAIWRVRQGAAREELVEVLTSKMEAQRDLQAAQMRSQYKAAVEKYFDRLSAASGEIASGRHESGEFRVLF